MREGKLWHMTCAVAAILWFIVSSHNGIHAQNNIQQDEWIEVIEKRTASSKLFTNGKGDFQLTQCAGNLHFINEQGVWEDIQREVSSIDSMGQAFGISRSELPIIINSASGASHMTFSKSGERMVMSDTKLEIWDMHGQVIKEFNSSGGDTEVTRNGVRLNNFFQAIDRVQWMDYWYLQTDFVIQQRPDLPEGTSALVFKDKVTLPAGWQIRKVQGEDTEFGWRGSLQVVDTEGNQMAELSVPIYYDASRKEERGEHERHAMLGSYRLIEIDGGYELCLVVDANWLRCPELIYPITIDPTINNTYASIQGLQDYMSQFNSNCQANLNLTLPAGGAVSVTNSSIQYSIRAKGLIATYGWDEYYAAGAEQRSRVGCGSNWTGVQYGYGESYYPQNIAYNISNSNIANGCYSGGTVLTYKWQAYQTFFPTYWGPYITTLSGCQTTYHELLANTWKVTVTYSTADITATASPQNLSICSGQPAVIQLSGNPSNVSFSWTASNIGTSGAQNGNGSVINQVLLTSTNGTATYTITPSANGCQGTPITVTVNVSAAVQSTVNAQMCPGSTYMFNGNTYTQPGTYQVTLVASNGCDSLVTLNLTTANAIVTHLNEAICQGSSYTIGNQSFSQPGSYSVSLQSSSGCDSIVNLELSILQNYQSSFDAWICPGESFSFGGTQYSSTGQHTHVFVAQNGCDSTVTLNLYLFPQANTNIPVEICSGSSYTFHGTTYNSAGSYPVILQNQYGCDSIVTLQLTLAPVITSTTHHQMCDGESYEFNQTIYTSPGTYQSAFQTDQGCDSIAMLQLTVHPRYDIFINDGFCPFDSYVFHGNTYSEPGVYDIHLVSSKGCDSIVHLNLSIHPLPLVDIGDEYNLCYGQNIQLQNSGTQGSCLWSTGSTDNRISVSSSGVYWLKVTSPAGCEDIDSCYVTVRPLPHTPDSLEHELCTGEMLVLNAANPGDTYAWNYSGSTSQEVTVSSPGSYSVRVTNAYGCSREFTFQVRKNCESAIYVPNAFSPNNDGINDYFLVKGENIVRFEMRIYNRWGEEVFFSDDVQLRWNGSVKGGEYYAPDGLYQWIIKLKFANDGTDQQRSEWKQLRGVVHLLR